ncbi:hypothetical protein BDZ89DRAFT_1063511, partial [Hymenopellis radicata]
MSSMASGFDYFSKAAYEAGIVKTFLEIAKDTRANEDVVYNTVNALNGLGTFLGLGNKVERLALTKQFVEYGGVRLCMEKADSDALCIPRHVAVICLRAFAGDGYLAEFLSVDQTSELMIAACRYILSGPSFFIDQMNDPETTFQSFFGFNRHGVSPSDAARYAPRYYAMGQENAARVIHALLCRRNPPSQRFKTDVLKHDSELIDLLMECLSFVRPDWYPESDVVSLTSESLSMLLGGTIYVVNGIEVDLSAEGLGKEYQEDREALKEALLLFLSRSTTISTLIIAWLNLEQEKWQTIKRNFYATKTKYLAQVSYELEEFLDIFQHRGNSRAAMLRIVAALTVIVPSELSDDTLLSFLHIGSSASQKLFPMNAIRQESDQYDYLDHNFEVFRMPLSAQGTQEQFDAPNQIAPEGILGPTVLVRLLKILHQRGKLAAPPKKLPVGVSGTTLAEVKSILSEDNIRRFLLLAKARTTERREAGHTRYKKDREPDFAGFAYYSAAELAAALVAFDDATAETGKWKACLRDVRMEVVMSLGNAAEMALGVRQEKKALYYATTVVQFAEKLAGTEYAVGDDYLVKNRRRAERARAAV